MDGYAGDDLRRRLLHRTERDRNNVCARNCDERRGSDQVRNSHGNRDAADQRHGHSRYRNCDFVYHSAVHGNYGELDQSRGYVDYNGGHRFQHRAIYGTVRICTNLGHGNGHERGIPQ